MFYDPERNLVVYDNAGLKEVPGAIALGNGYVAFDATLGQLQRLRALGAPILAPMDWHYDWPGKFKPFEAQRITANFMVTNPHACVLNDTGTGKTRSALWAADYLMRLHEQIDEKIRCLILAPLSTLETVWANEIFDCFFSKRKSIILHGSSARRIKRLDDDVDFYIVNYDGLNVAGLASALTSRRDIQIIIIDEASVYKHSNTLRHRSARKILSWRKYLWLMTATPTPNGPEDAYGIAKLVNGAGGESFTSYRERVMFSLGPWKRVPRIGAKEEALKLMQPAIRFAISECVDLPPMTVQRREVPLSGEQAKAYKSLQDECRLAMRDGSIVNPANQAVLRMKLIQIVCIAEGTSVLTPAGWWPIERVHPGDSIWDGETWVQHSGAICNGRKNVVETDGVWTTPDHLILSTEGWGEAERFNAHACNRLDRADVRAPDCFASSWDNIKIYKTSDLAVQMHLWDRSDSGEPKFKKHTSNKWSTLRMLARRIIDNARHVEHAAISNMDTYETPLQRSKIQRLYKLWSTRYFCLSQMEKFFRNFLAGYGGRLQLEIKHREKGQQRKLRTRQLPLGYGAGATTQSAAGERTFSAQTSKEGNTPKTKKEARVYDILNCGPRNSFVVRDKNGRGMIVHNCGVVYDGDKRTHEFDVQPRLSVLEEVIETTAEKVIVFAPLTSVVEMLYGKFNSKFSCAIVNGATSTATRKAIFDGFQNGDNPRVIFADPGTMAHGLTLTAATVIVWYGPTDKTELYLQGNKRIHRPGQVNATTIIQLTSTPVEHEIYRKLATNESMLGAILKLVEEKRG